ncbi:MAG: N-acetyltransferase [Bacteroidales bacterium]|nr:N-acetyltransferase [Bacteroidales bacterium]
MAIEIKAINNRNKNELKKFVKFGIDLYKDNDYYVPPLVIDEIRTLNADHNPAFDFCEAQPFMAYKDGKPAGTIMAIINRTFNERSGHLDLRFSNFETIDDPEVVDALFQAASDWGKARGMTSIVGPMGFTDMDHEGMLIEGFNELGTIATIYNHDYYPKHMERMGFQKDTDWIEFKMTVPDRVPDKYLRIADIVSKKYNLRVLKYTSRKKIKADYGQAVFQVINAAYDGLYGYCPLTPKQIDYYVDEYLSIIRLDHISIIVDENDELVGVGISMPSFSRALQKGRGKIFPGGWWHLLKAFRGDVDTVDLMLVAVKPEYQSKGVNALLFADLLPMYIRNGYKWAETNLELEDNHNVQAQWQYFERRQHRRRRAWRRPL